MHKVSDTTAIMLEAYTVKIKIVVMLQAVLKEGFACQKVFQIRVRKVAKLSTNHIPFHPSNQTHTQTNPQDCQYIAWPLVTRDHL